MRLFDDLQVRWKLLLMALPLVLGPVVLVGAVVGYISTEQAHRGITQTSADDLEHMTQFTLDLFDSHYLQVQVHKQDKKATIQRDLATLVDFAHNLVAAEQRQHERGSLTLAAAQEEARTALKQVSVGESGYIYAVTPAGGLVAHPAQEGANIYDAQDEDGRYFIREMARRAVAADPGEVLYTVYPWRNAVLGDPYPRNKVVAYRYFEPWGWILAAGSYLDETYEDVAFEQKAFEQLKARIKLKKVGTTGYIYAMDSDGVLTVHPFREGDRLWDEQDSEGRYFIREMCRNKSGWIRYPWQNANDPRARMKIVRYEYFEPWDWIVAVGSYEDEFYSEANKIRGRILRSMFGLTLAVALGATLLVFWASKTFTDPIKHMVEVIQRVRKGRLDERVQVGSDDELGQLGAAFNEMTEVLRHNKELEEDLAQQSKMASLGVLSSGVAHEINNPLGVILGYASQLERRIPADDPAYPQVREIKRECKRCKKIVQDLLSYARMPRPSFEEVDLNELLDQIADFAANHTDVQGVTVARDFATNLPPVSLDRDQIRQVAINLILNAGAAMADGGLLILRTELQNADTVCVTFADNGPGIPPERLEKIFEPFFTTKSKGTGLGLVITRQIVEQHQGTIRVDSEPGKGTTVTVCLPRSREVL